MNYSTALFSLSVPLLIIGMVFYFASRHRKNETGSPRHAYYYYAIFMALAILYIALSDLIRLLSNTWLISDNYNSLYMQQSLLRQIAGRLSAILVALPFWAFHWMKANPPDGKIDKYSKRTYSLFVVIILSMNILVGWSFLFYFLITWALGVMESDFLENIIVMLSYAIPGTFIWIWHFISWRKLNEEEKLNPSVTDK
jgi:hypothetical protein